jgi:hypothetical protein
MATFELAPRLDIDPLGIRRSGSGAFGLPQFPPSSYLRCGVDGNGDGRVSMYEPADASELPRCPRLAAEPHARREAPCAVVDM